MENGEAKKAIKCQTGTAEKVMQKHSSLSEGGREQGRQIHGDARASLAHQRKQNTEATGPDEDTKTWVGPSLYRSLQGLQLVSKCH